MLRRENKKNDFKTNLTPNKDSVYRKTVTYVTLLRQPNKMQLLRIIVIDA